jgi:epoxyqueuosine reductase
MAAQLELTKAVKCEAHRQGFPLVGVTTPEAPQSYTAFESWLADGNHGRMEYLAKKRNLECRADPLKILPECRSILVLGVPYSNPRFAKQPNVDSVFGRVSSYAWGNDYHEVLSERLRNLVAFIEMKVGEKVPNRWYTDTGPILERNLGQRAGLGWVGKNSMLINPQIGSYFFLAEILLGIDLIVDPPFRNDRCGSCTRCIDACPTDCILEERTLDARSCLSYLTIELKGPLPLGMREKVKGWVFGCDICQQVCPWNQRFAPLEGDKAFSARPRVPYVDLIQEVRISPEEFNRKFRHSPVKRAKRRGYLRNVVIVLGNIAEENAVPVLSSVLLEEIEELVRAHAAWALGRIGGEGARQALLMALGEEADESVRMEIQSALEVWL